MEVDRNQDINHLLTRKMIDNRTILIYGEINQDLAKEVFSQLLLLESLNDNPITIFINSLGGHIEAGDTIHDMIRFVKPEVRIIGTGWVASPGITIYLAAKKKNRFSLPNTHYMIHQPLGGGQGQNSEIEIEAREIIRMRERINRMISEATGQPLDKIAKDTNRNFWLSANAAIEYGIVNKIIQSGAEL
ncbi:MULTISPECIES: ATP-dependent Clp protease proteolytic subunit [Listeria]|uniref:ATP-dependent Clp protease proteolytic subunit n=1 Tax=Listeria TaxID=1637 RepID=UPI000B598058|nr:MULTISPECIES: ATP-dependent Clp protease proteolytic subunit [Listeria]